VNENNISDEELEEKLEKALKENEDKKNVFKIIQGENESLNLKEKRLKKTHKLKS
jgi:hypothetical protein